jgi:transposase
MPRKAQDKTNAAPSAPLLNPHAAGIDIGATTTYVAVPADQASEPVRSFGTFTGDLLALAQWLKECGIQTVAMEATSVYWIPLFQQPIPYPVVTWPWGITIGGCGPGWGHPR